MPSSSALPHLEEMVVATTRYLAALTDLSDDDMRAPSVLPGWSRGHVVTHLSRNADGLCNLLHWAETGVERHMYPSREQRDADIEAGASRSAADLREDAAASAGRLLQALNELDVAHEDNLVSPRPGAAPYPAREIPLKRRIEVEVHHVDLAWNYTPAKWPRDFALLLVDRIREDRADGPPMVLRATDHDAVWQVGDGDGPEVAGTVADLAWWLAGRGDGTRLVSSTGELPQLGPWR